MKPAMDYCKHGGHVGMPCGESNNVGKREYKHKTDRGHRFNSSLSTSPCSMQTATSGSMQSQKSGIEAFKYCQCHYAVDLGGEYFKEFLRKCKFGVEIEYKSLQPTNKKTTDYPQVCHKIACIQSQKSNGNHAVHANNVNYAHNHHHHTHQHHPHHHQHHHHHHHHRGGGGGGGHQRHASSSNSSLNGSGHGGGNLHELNGLNHPHPHAHAHAHAHQPLQQPQQQQQQHHQHQHQHSRQNQQHANVLGHEKSRVHSKQVDGTLQSQQHRQQQRHNNHHHNNANASANKGAPELMWNYSDAFPELGAKSPQKNGVGSASIVNVSNYYDLEPGEKQQQVQVSNDKCAPEKETTILLNDAKPPASSCPVIDDVLMTDIKDGHLVETINVSPSIGAVGVEKKSVADDMGNECSTASTLNETCMDDSKAMDVDDANVDKDGCAPFQTDATDTLDYSPVEKDEDKAPPDTADEVVTDICATTSINAAINGPQCEEAIVDENDGQIRCKDCKFNLVIPRLESFMNGDGTSGAPLLCYACRARRRQPLGDSAELLLRRRRLDTGGTYIDCVDHLSNASDEAMMLLRCSNVHGNLGNASGMGAPRTCPFVDFKRNGTVSSMEGLEASCIMCNKPPLAVAISPALSGDAAPKLQDALTQNALDESKGSRLVACTEKCTLNVLRGVVKSITPSAASIQKKLYLYKSMERLLKYSLGEDTQVCMAGSTSYDIDIEYGENYNGTTCYSDLDIEILSGRYAFNARAILTRVYHDMCTMQRIASENRLYNNWVLGNSKIKLVSTAKVPIVILSTPSGLICDVSVNVTNSLVHRDLFTLLINKHPNLRPFMRIIKHWIKLRGIPPMKRGGFPSVFWMVIFCNIVDCLEQDALDASQPPCSNGPKATWSAGDNAMLRWLEACFNLLCDGPTLAEMVQVFSGVVSLDSLDKPKWKMGPFGRDFVNLIEMDNSQPLGVWLVYYYELKRACKLLAEYRQHLEVLRHLENLLMQVDSRSSAALKGSNKDKGGTQNKVADLGVDVKEAQLGDGDLVILPAATRLDCIDELVLDKAYSAEGPSSSACGNSDCSVDGDTSVVDEVCKEADEEQSLIDVFDAAEAPVVEDASANSVELPGDDSTVYNGIILSANEDETTRNNTLLSDQESPLEQGGGNGEITLQLPRVQSACPFMTSIKPAESMDLDAPTEEEKEEADSDKGSGSCDAILIDNNVGVKNQVNATLNHEEEILKLAQRYKLRLAGTTLDRLYMLVCHVIQVAIATVLRIFEESNDRIYSIPAAVEPPLHLEYVINGLGQYPCACKLPDACRNLLNYMWLDSGWFIALVQQELAIIKVIKTCIHWDSWWSLDFTSRRDSRSVFHALVHSKCQVGNVTALARQGGVVLLNPSHIVSGLYVARLDRPHQGFGDYLRCLDPNTGRECVYLVPKYELGRINEFEALAATLGETLEASACKGYPNNKWIPTCSHCGAPDCYTGNTQSQQQQEQLMQQQQEAINDPALEAILEAMQRALVRQPAI